MHKNIIFYMLMVFCVLSELYAQEKTQTFSYTLISEQYEENTTENQPIQTKIEIIKTKDLVINSIDSLDCIGKTSYTFEKGYVYYVFFGSKNYISTSRVLDFSKGNATLMRYEKPRQDIFEVDTNTQEIRTQLRYVVNIANVHSFFSILSFEKEDKGFYFGEEIENILRVVCFLQKKADSGKQIMIKAYTDDEKYFFPMGREKAEMVKDVLLRNGFSENQIKLDFSYIGDLKVQHIEPIGGGQTIITLSMKK